jgi:hypothetical protein
MNEGRDRTKRVNRKGRIGTWLCRLISNVSMVTCIVFALSVSQPVCAKVFNISLGDVTKLIKAINKANANGQDNTINLEAGTYTLMAVDNDTDGPNGLPSITSNITINGAGADITIIERDTSAPSFRIFHVSATGSLTLNGITIRRGGSSTSDFIIVNGGGIFNNGGIVNVINSTISENIAALGPFRTGPDSKGGGIFNKDGFVNVNNSIIAKNGAFDGGGIFSSGTLTIYKGIFTDNGGGIFTGGSGAIDNSGTMTITKSSIINNGSSGTGGILNSGQATIIKSSIFNNSGELNSGGFSSSGTLNITNSTIADNFSTNGTGGILNTGTLSITNCTIADNHSGSPSAGIANTGKAELQNTILALNLGLIGFSDCSGTITSLGNNIIGDTTNCTVDLQASDLTGDPGLDTFTDNGTPSNGHFPLVPNSQAIDAGNNAICLANPILATDQVGQPRIGVCDIGAIEFQQQINDKVSFEPIASTFRTTSNTNGCPSGFVGKLSFNARLTDKNTSPPLSSLIIQVANITNGNLLQNADGGPGGVGATLTPPNTSLSPGRSEKVLFVICLKQMGEFSFFVNILGIAEQ